jgi:TfoX/Sxy family transcriptional regulator of competence genes
VRQLLASHRDVREVAMFGGISFMVDGRMAVAVGRDGDLLVRTDPARYDELLRRGGEPAEMGAGRRPMGRGWLTVPGRLVAVDQELSSWLQVGMGSEDATGSGDVLAPRDVTG